MIAALNLDHVARMSAGSILNCMLEGLAIGLFAWILLRVLGRRNSSTRFAVWFSALLAIAALPVIRVAVSTPQAGTAGSAITVPSSWAFDIFIVWALIAGVWLLRVGAGLLQLRKLRASCTAIDTETLNPLLQTTLQEFQSVRPVALCHSDRIQVPTAIGFLKPLVVIPSWALQELSTSQLNSILIHELAHLRRRDDWTNLAQKVLKALLFFHPAVWWIENQLALEREMACDDAVLAETGNPRGYAQCLVSMAEKTFLRRGLAMAQAAVSRMRQTSLRVSQILDVNRSSATRVWKPALYSVAAFLVVCLISLSHAPELVAFKDRAPDVSAIRASTGAASDASSVPQQYANATPVSFHERPFAEPLRPTHGVREPLKTLAPQNANHRIRKGSNLILPQIAESKSGFQLLGQGTLEEARLSTTTKPAQAIFLVMQTAVYDDAGPVLWRISVWRVTVLDSTRRVESRIPAKQI
ncbi:MAG TPA: M56 family metallopeptidase [Terriglobales bacterium]|jgi:beta-lactamase regulating signal transducer with metallopeptidase domain|nr:M56 family metallopeptidase [Terriglobales bacterium]